MKVLIFTKEDAPEMRDAKELGGRLESEGYEVDYLESDQEATVDKQYLYDIYAYPSFVIIREDGGEIEAWRGTIPLITDLKNLLNQ